MSSIGVLHVVPRLEPGGITNLIFNLLSRMPPEKWRCSVCALMDDPPSAPPYQGGDGRSPLSPPYEGGDGGGGQFRRHGIPVLNVGLRRTSGLPAMARSILAIGSYIRRHDIAVVHTHLDRSSYYGRLAARLLGVPVIVRTIHGIEPFSAKSARREKRMAGRTDAYVAVSDHCRRYVSLPKEMQVIHNGVQADVFRPDPAARPRCRSEHGWSDDEIVVGSVSRASPEKNLHDFVRAAVISVQMDPRLRFVVAGDGPQFVELNDLAARLGLADKLTFLGHVDDVPSLLNALDLFVLPSLMEGLPLSLVEAMMVGVCVIANPVGGIPEVVDSETGLLTREASPEAVAELICRAASDPGLRQTLAENGRARALANFSCETLVDKTERLYESILARKGRL